MMRLFGLVLILLFSVPALANATPITKDAANAYFENCKSQPKAEGLTAEGQKYMCACTAAQMMNKMSVEDVQAMSQQSQAGRNATNKMLINVYAPCINYPAKDHYYHTCMTNPKTKTLSRSPESLCGCMATQVAEYLKQNGEKVFREILAKDPNIVDPMTALTNDPKFTSYAQSKLLGCVTR